MDAYIKDIVEYKVEGTKVVWRPKKRLPRNMSEYLNKNVEALNRLIRNGTFKISRRGRKVRVIRA